MEYVMVEPGRDCFSLMLILTSCLGSQNWRQRVGFVLRRDTNCIIIISFFYTPGSKDPGG